MKAKVVKKQIDIVDLFSGIGTQRRGFENSGVFEVNVINTSEIASKSIITYAAMHCGMTEKWLAKQPNLDKNTYIDYLQKLNIDYDFVNVMEKNWSTITENKLKKIYYACQLTNNLGDIRKISRLNKADLWFYSFPYTDILNAEEQKVTTNGLVNRSGLLWEVERLLSVAEKEHTLPSFLCLETVEALLQDKFKEQFYLWLKKLSDFGYNTYYGIINALDTNVPQNRPRFFVVSILKKQDTKTFVFPRKMKQTKHLNDILNRIVDDKYYLSEQVAERFQFTTSEAKNVIGTTKPDFRTIGQRDVVYRFDADHIGSLVATDYKQPKQVLTIPFYANTFKIKNDKKFGLKEYFNATDSYNSVTYSEVTNPNRFIRRITPLEGYLLMGLTEKDYKKTVDIGISEKAMYEMLGNGSVTNCVMLLAQHLYKAQFDKNFKCKDEK